MKKEMTYLDSVHRDGRIWNISVMIALFMYPILVGVLFGVLPDWHGLLMGLVATAPMYWAVAVVETFTYVPMLGAGGSYLSFVTGNISNLKLPVALNALEQAGANIRTEEGEIVSTIAIAVTNGFPSKRRSGSSSRESPPCSLSSSSSASSSSRRSRPSLTRPCSPRPSRRYCPRCSAASALCSCRRTGR